MQLKIAPSILAADFTRLGEQVRSVDAAGADMVHVDVMDGHFVPNISMGPLVVEALRRTTELTLDVHLMITDPERYLDAFVKAGANHVTFHVEAAGDPVVLARSLRDRGIGAGLCLNPETPVDRVLDLLPEFDMVLIMTVHPGFGGQSFLAENLEKARRIREREKAAGRRGKPLDVEVDGGIGLETIARACDAGCNVFVAGNSIFGAPDPGAAVRGLRETLENHPSAVGGGPSERENSS